MVGLENIPKEGGCIAVSNHPLGGLDAMAIVPEIQNIRTDLKYIVNDILLHITQLNDIFTGVNKVGTSSRESLRKVEALFASEKLIMIFPSGLVSRRIEGKIIDLKWQKSFVSRAKKYDHPIIPIYTEGRLSNWFYSLSNIRKRLGIKANIEMLYLADEMFKQRGRTIRYRIGKPIFVNQLDTSWTNDEICSYVRKELYNLAE
jgi:putative hemolysin